MIDVNDTTSREVKLKSTFVCRHLSNFNCSLNAGLAIDLPFQKFNTSTIRRLTHSLQLVKNVLCFHDTLLCCGVTWEQSQVAARPQLTTASMHISEF